METVWSGTEVSLQFCTEKQALTWQSLMQEGDMQRLQGRPSHASAYAWAYGGLLSVQQNRSLCKNS